MAEPISVQVRTWCDRENTEAKYVAAMVNPPSGINTGNLLSSLVGLLERVIPQGESAREVEELRAQRDALLAACMDAEAALEWEDPHGETGISREERVAECLALLRAAIAKARDVEPSDVH